MRTWPAPIDHCYILCDPVKEPDRANYLTSWIRDNDVDPSCITLCSDCYGTDPMFQTSSVWSFYNPWSTAYGRRIANGTSKNMKPAEISLVLNFIGAARRAVEVGHKVVMILESDVLFLGDFWSSFTAALQTLPPAWDVMSLSASANMVPTRDPAKPDQRWFSPTIPYFHTRCADSMVYRVDLLRRMLGTMVPFGEVLDWELNFQLSLHGAKTLWLDPPVTRAGSEGSVAYATTL
jgi:hypothetical protein